MKTQQIKIRYLAFTGVMAALITVFTAFFVHIPVGFNGGYVHFGDALIYLSAALLPAPYAMAAGAIGGGLADLLTAPMWTLPTILIKMLIALPFTSQGRTFLNKRNLVAPWISFVITAVGYYLAEVALFGVQTAFLASVSGSVVQAAGSAVFFYLLGVALDKTHVKDYLKEHVFPVTAKQELRTHG